MKELPFRQIHLDFHTSPLIPDVGADFDPQAFAATLKDAHVNSINIFAKCHHGMSYYPSKVGPMHPSLKRDMLGEMIESLHAAGIKCPVYTTVVWDEHAAETHPEWLQLDSHGKVVGREPYAAGAQTDGERWRYLCLNTPYMDYLSAQVDEIMQYDVDGLWFDIVMYSEDGCSCNRCIRDMQAKGLDPSDSDSRRTHVYEVLRSAMDRLYSQVKAKKPDALVFFNGRQTIDVNPVRSLRRELPYLTHIEIESLPSGHWGYNHFPMYVRYNQKFGKEIIGMNGKFHKSWADFGGYKNRAALDFECFNMLASGAKVCIGDQLHPRGKLEKATYELIGPVLAEIEACEPWCSGAVPVANIGLMAVNDGAYLRANRADAHTLEAASQMLLEDHRHFQIIDTESDLKDYELVVFPDIMRFDSQMAAKVKDYLAAGGKVLLSGESGLDKDSDAFAIDIGAEYKGKSEYKTTYLRVGEPLRGSLMEADYAIYERGAKVLPTTGEVLAQVVEPYFDRSWSHFMSHQQTPADKLSDYAAAVRSGGVLYFANPIFRTYKAHGNLVFKKLVSNAIDLLLGQDLVQSNLPSTARVTVLDQPDEGRRVVHVLHYPIERRAEIDIIEDTIPLFDVEMDVRTAFAPGKVYLAPEKTDLPFTAADGRVQFRIPKVNGHQMVVIEP